MKHDNEPIDRGGSSWILLLPLAIHGWLVGGCVGTTIDTDTAKTATVESELSVATLTVDLNDLHQTIDGFGVAQPGGDALEFPPNQATARYLSELPQPFRDSVLDLAFSEVKGIGLTILRTRVEGMMERAPGVWNDVDESQKFVMNEAAARGPVKLIASVWSPPAWMKDNGLAFGGLCSNTGLTCFKDDDCATGATCLPASLRPSLYQSYADFLSHFAKQYAASNKVDFYAISMTNEPDTGIHADFRPPPEGEGAWDTCAWTGDQIATFLSDYLAPTFAANHVTTKVIAPESATWDPDEPLMTKTYATQRARDRVDIVAAHPYTGRYPQPLKGAQSLHKKVWQTEISRRHPIWNIASALDWAKDINDGLTQAQINAWLWFIMVAGQADMEEGGLIGAIAPNGVITGVKPSPLFFVLGNFSKFIRPGFVRIGATSSAMLDVSAYKSPTGDQVVIVAINRNVDGVDLKLQIPGINAQTVTQYITSATQSLQRQRPVPITSTMRIPGQSIVTYVSSPQGVYRTSDVLWHNVITGEYTEWIMANGQVSAPETHLFAEPAEWHVQGVGDFNGDGTSDILWHNVNTGEYTEWIMANGQVIGPETHLFVEPSEWQVEGVGDFNGDGTSDILWRNTNTGQLADWLMTYGHVGTVNLLGAKSAEWHVRGIGDFNGDGNSDILWHNVNTGEFTESMMTNGQITSPDVPLFIEPAEWQVQGVGDFDGNGTSDILWRNVNTGQLAEWMMANGGVGGVIILDTKPAAWQVQGIGDFNGDGSSDILWRNVNTGELSEWLLWNGRVQAPEVPLYTEPGDWQVQGIGDFNGQ
jgi:O-glycosyl hydrolase